MKYGQISVKILNGAIIVCMMAIIALFTTTPVLAKYIFSLYIVQNLVFCYTAVSYTHLDVYKRQTLYWTNRTGTQEKRSSYFYACRVANP